METIDKEKELERMIQELKDGKDEKEVKAEFERLFPEEDAWNQSSKASIGNLTINREYTPLSEEKNPLVLLAEENGAFRALMKTIRIDLNQEDDVSKAMLCSSFQRIQALSIHYKKMKELVFPRLEQNGIENTKTYQEKEDKVLLQLKAIEEELSSQPRAIDKEKILRTLDSIESNIVEENRFFFPVLESYLNDIELYEMYLEEKQIGFALIRV